MIGARIKPMFEELAKKRQLSTLKQNTDSANLRYRIEPRKAASDAAKAVNVSPRSVEHASMSLGVKA